jgi:hypothetical protein
MPDDQALPDFTEAVPLCFEIGWTMAQLFGPISEYPGAVAIHLPSIHEMGPRDRIPLECDR